MQPGWCAAAWPARLPSSRRARPRPALPCPARPGRRPSPAAGLVTRPARQLIPAPRPGEGAGAERSRLGSGPGHTPPPLPGWVPVRPQAREVLGVCPSQADPGLLRWAKRLSGMRSTPAHRAAGRDFGSRCATLRTGCLRASMLTKNRHT